MVVTLLRVIHKISDTLDMGEEGSGLSEPTLRVHRVEGRGGGHFASTLQKCQMKNLCKVTILYSN